MSARNTIVLIGDIERRYDEGRVAAALSGKILPGYMIEKNADGEYQRNSGAAVACEALIAVEDDFRGMTVEGDLPSDGVVAGGSAVGYIAADLIRFHICQPGDVVQLVLKAGETATDDSFLTSNGDGTVQVQTSTEDKTFKAMEEIDLSGSGAVDTFIKARKV